MNNNKQITDTSVSSNLSLLLPIIIFCLASFFYFYDYFVQVAPSIMTDHLMHDFSIGAANLGILGAGFFYTYIFMQIPAGILLDRFGARILLALAVFISACGILWFSTTHDFTNAVISRSLVGFGSAFSFVGALYLAAQLFQHRYFAILAGIVQLFGCLGAIFGLAPLASAVNHYGWREVLHLMGLFTFLLSVLFFLMIRDKKPSFSKNKMVKQTYRIHWKYLFHHQQIWWVIICGFVSWMSVAAVGGLWGVPYLMKVFNITNTLAGKICSLFWVALGVGSIFIAYISEQIKTRRYPLIICFIIGLLGVILLIQAQYLPIWVSGVALFLLGFSCSVQSLSFALIRDITPLQQFGAVSGLNNMSAIIGGAISQIAIGYMLSLQWNGALLHGVPVYTVNEYRTSLIIIPIGFVIGIYVSFFKIKETHCEFQGISNDQQQSHAL